MHKYENKKFGLFLHHAAGFVFVFNISKNSRKLHNYAQRDVFFVLVVCNCANIPEKHLSFQLGQKQHF